MEYVFLKQATSNKCIATRNKCLTSALLLETSATESFMTLFFRLSDPHLRTQCVVTLSDGFLLCLCVILGVRGNCKSCAHFARRSLRSGAKQRSHPQKTNGKQEETQIERKV